MKYMVMECHKAYAVLMDEDSRFVHAANLRYKVGQVVTDPVLMDNTEAPSRNIRMIVTAAAAACLVLFAGTGYRYYASNFKTHSTIVISTEANITMELNSKGEVLSLKSDTEKGREILKSYSGKGKDKTTVANELIEIEKSKGLISEGDNVEFYVSSYDPDTIGPLQQEMNDIKSKLEAPTEKKAAAKSAEPVPPAENRPAEEAAPPAPAAPKADEKAAAPKADEKAVTPPKADPVQPVTPAEPPVPEPPKAEEPAEHKAEEAPVPQTPAEAPKPAEKLPHERNERPAHEEHAAEHPAPEARKDKNNVIHKPQERLPELTLHVPEAGNNEPALHAPKAAEPKADNESPISDLP